MMCRVLKVSVSGYYAWKWRKPSAQQQRREVLTEAIETFHADSKSAYG
jgi:putative transposase